MSNPSWSANNSSFTTLPGYYVLGGKPKSSDEENIVHETGNGRIFVYNMYTRDMFELLFRIKGDTDLQSFRDLHDYAAGMGYPFYFSLSGAGASDSIYVRKEAGFDPKETGDKSPGSIMYEYTLRLRQELT